MDNFKQYILTVTAASLLTGILCSFCTGKLGRELIRLVSGVLLTIVVISPIIRLDLSSDLNTTIMDTDAANIYCIAGADMAQKAASQIIKQETEAYILAKAKEWGAEVLPKVTVRDKIPVAAEISGSLSPGMEKRISEFLEQDLGIPKENLKWT